MKKNRFVKIENNKQHVTLQITSMADIFTILLVFLLKSYASSDASVSPVSVINLPKTQVGKPPQETLHLEISSNAVLVAGKRIIPLQNFLLLDDENLSLEPLKQAIGMERGRQLSSVGVKNENGSDLKEKIDTRITIMVDQKVPYQTLKKIMSVAANQGYTDFRLATVKVNE